MSSASSVTKRRCSFRAAASRLLSLIAEAASQNCRACCAVGTGARMPLLGFEHSESGSVANGKGASRVEHFAGSCC
eukprot:536373-Prymnesium_polylepis.1